jgi:hypothetical protein
MTHVESIVEKFLNTNEKKMFNNYATDGKVLVFIDPIKREKDLIAIKFNNIVLGNSSVLELVRRKETGKSWSVNGVSEVQKLLSQKITMVPFSVFKQAKLDLSKFELLEKGPEETFNLFVMSTRYNEKTKEYDVIKTDIKQHFTGACLFKIQGEVYLFDVDRNELANNIVNPFLVNVSDSKVKTISQAYESLKPQAVKDAEKEKLSVKRQGEWFFIPTKVSEAFVKEHYKTLTRQNELAPLILQAGPNRPNYAKLGFEALGLVYVKGKISHSGREHKDLELKQWHIAIPNTATKSWTVTGDVD